MFKPGTMCSWYAECDSLSTDDTSQKITLKGVEKMTLKELTSQLEEKTGRKIRWELGKQYTAIDINTGETVAKYNPQTEILEIQDHCKSKVCPLYTSAMLAGDWNIKPSTTEKYIECDKNNCAMWRRDYANNEGWVEYCGMGRKERL